MLYTNGISGKEREQREHTYERCYINVFEQDKRKHNMNNNINKIRLKV